MKEKSTLGGPRDEGGAPAAERPTAVIARLYESVVGALDEGVVVVEQSGRIALCNPSAERILGRSPGELHGFGLSPWTMLREDGSSFATEALPVLHTLRTGHAHTNVVVGVFKPDGTLAWLSLSSHRLTGCGEMASEPVLVSFADVTRRRGPRFRSQYAVTDVLSSASSFRAVAARLVEALGQALSADVGEVWCPEPGAGALRRVAVWHRTWLEQSDFVARGADIALLVGQSLVGRVAAGGRAEWLPDARGDRGFVRRALAERAGLQSGFAFAVRTQSGTEAVIVFFTREFRTRDEDLLLTLDALGRQIAEFIEKKRAEEALRKSEERYRTLFEDSKDAVLIMNRGGRVVEVNSAALDLFARSREDMLRLSLGDFFLRPRQLRTFLRSLARRDGARELAATLRRSDGGVLECLVTATARRDERGRIFEYGGIVRDVTAQVMRDQALRTLSVHLLQAQDEERRRLARELHDSTGQHLVALSLNLATLRSGANRLSARARRSLGDSEALAERCMAEIRTLSYLLHPPLLDEMGLLSALRWLADGFHDRSGIRLDLELPEQMERLGSGMETALFRIVQEALTNVHRHSGSSRAAVRLSVDEHRVTLEVKDEGRGLGGQARWASADGTFVQRSGVGITGMKERVRQLGGQLDVVSTATGTTVRAILPLVEDR